jgi:hypothetical protein
MYLGERSRPEHRRDRNSKPFRPRRGPAAQTVGTILTRASCTALSRSALMLGSPTPLMASEINARQCRLALWLVAKLDHILVDHD